MALPNSGVATYNGYTFNESTETLEFTLRPIKSADGRTIKETIGRLTLRTKIAGTPTDAEVNFAVTRLTQPAAGLLYSGRGFSTVSVNLGRVAGRRISSADDLNWGPFPEVVSLRTLGGERCVELTWTVTWSAITCGDGVSRDAIQEFVYKLVESRDRAGYTTRTYSGHVTIPLTRNNITDRTVRTSADAEREKVVPPMPPGFRRESATYELSEDRKTETFTIVDVELPPNAPPPGVVEAESSHRFSSEPGKFLNWLGTFSASYEVAKGTSIESAVDAFFALMNDRIAEARRKMRGVRIEGGPGVPGRIGTSDKALFILPWQFSLEDGAIYGRQTARFQFSYRIPAVNLDQILAHGGLWKAIPAAAGGRQKEWQASLAKHLGPRGVAGDVVRFNPRADDFIVDLCRKITRPKIPVPTTADLLALEKLLLLGIQVGTGIQFSTLFGDLNKLQKGIQRRLQAMFPAPRPESSFLDYTAAVHSEAESGVVLAQALPTSAITRGIRSPSGGWDPVRDDFPVVPGNSAFPALETRPGSVQAQRRTQPVIYVRLTGRAVRAGYPVPMPELTSINGKRPTLVSRVDAGEGFVQQAVGNGLTPLYCAAWNLRYVVDDVDGLRTGELPVPRNTLFGTA